MTDRRGRVLRTALVKRALAEQAAVLPEGTTVRHTGGRTGIVRADSADHVPGIHLGRPTAHCLTSEDGARALVCVVFATEAGVPLRAWVPVETVARATASQINRPSLAVKDR